MKDMNPDALREFLAVRPFEHVEVELSSGQVWTIRHPENAMVLKNTLVVADPDKDLVRWIAIIHIVSVSRKQTTSAA